MIQVEVSAINGLSVVTPKEFSKDEKAWKGTEQGAEIDSEKAIISRSNIALANIFFKVSQLYSCSYISPLKNGKSLFEFLEPQLPP